MSGGHWEYLALRLEERAGQPLNEAWKLLAGIERELDYGICCDTCYDCAKIRVIKALEAYFDTEATTIENAYRILRSSTPECDACKAHLITPRVQQPRETAVVELVHHGKKYRGTVYVEEE